MNPRIFALTTQLALGAALFGFSCAASAADTKPAKTTTAAPAAQQEKEVVARVNGKPIYAGELERIKKALLSGRQNLQIPADQQKEFDRVALNQLTSAELLYQAGQKLDTKDIDKQVEEKVSQGKARFATPAEFQKAIANLGMTESELRDYTRRDMIIAHFVHQTFASKVTVSDEECKKFYDQNQDKFKQSEQVRASHILIGVDPKADTETRKKAREKAEKLRKELAGGADFATLARENSTCPSSQQGGDLGYFGRGQMVPSFEQAAFSLKEGEVSDVVETQFGYHIIRQMGKKNAETVSYEDAKGRIADYLKGQKVNAAVSAYLENARKTSKIETFLK
jgi:peptidyl-prolyl cis-trans isomerase C